MSARTPLRVAAAQPLSVLGDVSAGVAAHAAAVRHAASDLVVFPELSLTGYDHLAPAIDPADPALTPLIAACAAHDCVALAGAPVATGSARAIGVLRVDADGARVAYRKMSLGETEVPHFAPGETAAVVTVDGWRIGIGVCKDTRITEHLDATAALGIDLYAAGLVHAPDELSELDERATRIAARYDVPVVFAACAGPSGNAFPHTSGGSAIWDHTGAPVSRAGTDPGEIVTVSVSRIRSSRRPRWSHPIYPC